MNRILNGEEIEMTDEEIQALEQSRAQMWDLDNFTTQLSSAFDAKFETYWKAKEYSDLHDLNSHVANPNSPHHTEALALIQWSHEQWELAVANIDEQSNIQEIINSLQVYE
jgi:hypothetical protein